MKTIKNDSGRTHELEKADFILEPRVYIQKVRNVDAERVSVNLIMGIIEEEEEGDEAEGAQNQTSQNIEQSASTTKQASNSTRKIEQRS